MDRAFGSGNTRKAQHWIGRHQGGGLMSWTALDAASTGRFRDAEWLEAEVRKEMARHAAIQARGFDSVHAREVIHVRIDNLLDEWGLVS